MNTKNEKSQCLPGLKIWTVLCEKVPNILRRCHTKNMTPTFPKKKKMQLDVDVSPPAITLLGDMNPKC